MATMVLDRDYVLETVQGHLIRFVSGVPVNVPRYLVPKAMSIGAKQLEDGEGDKVKQPVPPQVMSAEDRADAIRTIIDDIVSRNDPADFTGSGTPSQASVSRKAGFVVAVDEVKAAWDKFQHDLKAKKEEDEKKRKTLDSQTPIKK